MSFEAKNLLFTITVKDPKAKQIALRLSDGGQELVKAEVDCGRTSGDSASVYVTGEAALTQLKQALQDVLAKL